MSNIWTLTEEQTHNIREQPESFNNESDIKSIQRLVEDLASIAENDDGSDLCKDILSLLDNCWHSSVEFEEWGESWRHEAIDKEQSLYNMLDNLKVDYRKTVTGKDLVDYRCVNYGNYNFRNLVDTYFGQSKFDIMGSTPYCEAQSGHQELHIIRDGRIRYGEEKLLIDLNTLRLTVNGETHELRDCFVYWWMPTQEEADYFEMVTGYNYWINDLRKLKRNL